MVGVVNQAVFYDIVEHFQMVLFQTIEIFEFRSDIFVLFFNDPPKEIIFEGLQKTRYFVSD